MLDEKCAGSDHQPCLVDPCSDRPPVCPVGNPGGSGVDARCFLGLYDVHGHGWHGPGGCEAWPFRVDGLLPSASEARPGLSEGFSLGRPLHGPVPAEPRLNGFCCDAAVVDASHDHSGKGSQSRPHAGTAATETSPGLKSSPRRSRDCRWLSPVEVLRPDASPLAPKRDALMPFGTNTHEI